MIYLNFSKVDNETQERLLSISKEDVESRSGNELRQFAQTQDLDHDGLFGLPFALSNVSNAKSIHL
ncbi:MAG: hypothetical protein RIM83_08145 [Allomuricauda sp.]